MYVILYHLTKEKKQQVLEKKASPGDVMLNLISIEYFTSSSSRKRYESLEFF